MRILVLHRPKSPQRQLQQVPLGSEFEWRMPATAERHVHRCGHYRLIGKELGHKFHSDHWGDWIVVPLAQEDLSISSAELAVAQPIETCESHSVNTGEPR